MDDSAVLLDTNVLLDATAPARDLHSMALAVFNEWPQRGFRLCTSGQILREYLVVATRDLDQNGLGLTVADALANIAAFAERCRFLAEGPEVADRLRDLLRTVTCAGKQIHDANLVATALVHGVTGLVTANLEDFKRFEEHLEVIALSPGPRDAPTAGP